MLRKKIVKTQDFIIHMRQFDNFFRDGDWNCLKCGGNNFSRRTFCFKCKTPKEERGSFRGDRRDSEGPHPGDQRHFGQAQPPMHSPQSTVSSSS